jgi:hypothetical protein
MKPKVKQVSLQIERYMAIPGQLYPIKLTVKNNAIATKAQDKMEKIRHQKFHEKF